MRIKWYLVLALSAMLMLGASFLERSVSPAHQRDYQHKLAANAAYCDPLKIEAFCSHLPLVLIDTNDHSISEIYEIVASVQVIDNTQGHNHLDSDAALSSSARIKVRGNSSARFDKKQYRVTFVQESDAALTKNLSVMGMPPESDWVLNGPFLDKSLVRNYLMYNLSGELMDWSPNVRYCEVFLNGEYQGLYLMIEAVKVGKDRVNVTEVLHETHASTGYLVARERPGDTKYPLNDFATYSVKTTNELGVAYPNTKTLTPLQAEYIRQNLSAFEKMLYSLDYDDIKKGYAAWIDIQSFVDYFLLNEFSLNSDAGALSTYAHKDIRSKLKMGPVWDFNNAFDNFQDYVGNLEDFCMIDVNWYVMLLRDEIFVETLIDRYHGLRKNVLNEERVMQIIDETIAWLGPAIDRNFEVWGFSFDLRLLDSDNSEGGRDLHSYEEAVAQLKSCIEIHGRFLDEYIVALRQFSAESAVKEWN